MKVKQIEERELTEVWYCYDCATKLWKEFDTGWLSQKVAEEHKLKGHDVRSMKVIPDEGILEKEDGGSE